MTTSPSPTPQASPSRRRLGAHLKGKGLAAALLVLCLSVMAGVLASSAVATTGWNYTSPGGPCVWGSVDLNPGGLGTTNAVYGTASYAAGGGPSCSSNYNRPAGYIQVKGQLLKSSSAGGPFGNCSTSGWYSNPVTHQYRFITIDYGSVTPCGSGYYTAATHSKVMDGGGTWRPNADGTPRITLGYSVYVG